MNHSEVQTSVSYAKPMRPKGHEQSAEYRVVQGGRTPPINFFKKLSVYMYTYIFATNGKKKCFKITLYYINFFEICTLHVKEIHWY